MDSWIIKTREWNKERTNGSAQLSFVRTSTAGSGRHCVVRLFAQASKRVYSHQHHLLFTGPEPLSVPLGIAFNTAIAFFSLTKSTIRFSEIIILLRIIMKPLESTSSSSTASVVKSMSLELSRSSHDNGEENDAEKQASSTLTSIASFRETPDFLSTSLGHLRDCTF